METCELCFGKKFLSECLVRYENKQDKCPCRKCIVQITCHSNVCVEFEKFMFDIHESRDSWYKFGGPCTWREPTVRGV